MKTLMAKDLNGVFFDVDEFGLEIIHTNEPDAVVETLSVVFDKKTEVVLDGASEFGDATALMPSILLSTVKAGYINSRSTFLVEAQSYAMSFKEEENADMTRVYLEKRGV